MISAQLKQFSSYSVSEFTVLLGSPGLLNDMKDKYQEVDLKFNWGALAV